MSSRFIVFLFLSGVVVGAWGQSSSRWVIVENTPGKPGKTTTYEWSSPGPDGTRTLTTQRDQRIQTTVVSSSGTTLRWTKVGSGTSLDLQRDGREFVSRSVDGSQRMSAPDSPWFQDLTLLGAFVQGSEKEIRFLMFADLPDARLKASDMTVLKATKVKRETVSWGTGSGEAWKVRVTFDDLRSTFWGADYWYRVSDGRLVRFEEVRGGPGTPATVGTLGSDQ